MPLLRKILTLGSIAASLFLSAQSGERVYPFLNIPVTARQAALGGDAVSVRDFDVGFALINPALMNIDQDKMITLNYAGYLAGTKFGTMGTVKDLGEGHLISLQARYMDYGSIPRTDEDANTSGDFTAMDASFGVGYAYQFEDDWTIGGGLNFVTSKIDSYTSMAVAATGGVTYHNPRTKETLAVVARNFGYQFKTFNGERERLPFRVDLGYTKILDEFPLAYTITLHDLQQVNISANEDNNGQKVGFGRKLADHFSFGAELFPEQAFNLRVGYNVKRGNELAVQDQRSFAGLSFGFGIKISSFRLDYSHIRYTNAANVNQFGITMDLVELSGQRR